MIDGDRDRVDMSYGNVTIVKLTLALEDPILGRWPRPPPLPEIIDREEEWVVEEILDSRVVNQKLRYLVKWEGFGIEHNSWESWDNIHAPDLVANFHRKHSGAPQHIRLVDFNDITFHPNPLPAVLGRHSLEEGGRCQGTPSKTHPYHEVRCSCSCLLHSSTP